METQEIIDAVKELTGEKVQPRIAQIASVLSEAPLEVAIATIIAPYDVKAKVNARDPEEELGPEVDLDPEISLTRDEEPGPELLDGAEGGEAVAPMVADLAAASIDADVIEAMLAAGLATMEDVHAHPDLTSIKGIGEATRNKLLAI